MDKKKKRNYKLYTQAEKSLSSPPPFNGNNENHHSSNESLPRITNSQHSSQENTTNSQSLDRWKTPRSTRSDSQSSHLKSGSIYEYLDALEQESESGTHYGSPTSLASFDSKKSYRPSNYAWDDRGLTRKESFTHTSTASTHYGNNQEYTPNGNRGLKERVIALTIELQDKAKTVDLLKAKRKKDEARRREDLQLVQAEAKKQIQVQKEHFEKEIERHLDFTQQLVQDKTSLMKRCDDLLVELQKMRSYNARETERYKFQSKSAKQQWMAQEKLKREDWLRKKTEEIKKTTVKALEPDIQAILAKNKDEIEKTREIAAEDRRKLQIQLNREHAITVERLNENFERRLAECREKEHIKLVSRLDSAEVELQQQLTQQRRRIQEEAEAARNELYAELQATNMRHAQEVQALKTHHATKIDQLIEKHQNEKKEWYRKHDVNITMYQDQNQKELENCKEALRRKLELKFDNDKRKLEQQMKESRDAKIQVVIEKLQQECRAMVHVAEEKAHEKWESERKELEQRLRHTSEIEDVWMEKTRSLQEKCSSLQIEREQCSLQNTSLAHEVEKGLEKAAEVARFLQEEKETHQREVRKLQSQLDEAIKLHLEVERKHQQGAESWQHQISNLTESQTKQLQVIEGKHEEEMNSLHARVRTTMSRKDQIISDLQEQLHLLEVKLETSQALIEEQRAQLFGD
uniref:Uncharacterized protein AlNc14C139G7195 n=1 Tax=Albugo laibachii Nc14 TaxID=890382 RepID=F0WL06_9STRA|nr:conserved hypothetical protein [Albugo laibachii Nc14]|eukprot:CCA21965.1 conserved hypothetical protein [Albugo laibachii Nc14]